MNTIDYILNKFQVKGDTTPYIILENSSKFDFALLLNELGYKKGAEIGVETGGFSKILCDTIPGLKLTCVDPWEHIPGYRDHKSSVQDSNYEFTKKRLEPYKCKIIRALSMDAVKKVPDNSLDFVYIDANHDFRHCTDDIAEWSNKVRSGGIISGHDFAFFRTRGELIHTKHVVIAWTEAYVINPWFVFDHHKIWFWVKK